MNIPGFTAETSLYKTNGHYQTSRPAFTSVTTAIRAFHPAAEVIEVFGCPPGSTMVGTPPDDWYCLPDPLTEPGSGGQSPVGDGSDTERERYGGGPGSKKRTKKRTPIPKPPKPGEWDEQWCSPKHTKNPKWKECLKLTVEDWSNSVEDARRNVCQKGTSNLLCCRSKNSEGQYNDCEPELE
jgi:hypothetical protein